MGIVSLTFLPLLGKPDLIYVIYISFLFPQNRFAVSFISWGISFSAPFLGGSVYVNVLISAVAAGLVYPVCAALTVW